MPSCAVQCPTCRSQYAPSCHGRSANHFLFHFHCAPRRHRLVSSLPRPYSNETLSRAWAEAENASAAAHTHVFRIIRLIMAQYVYTMRRVGKVVPPKRVILKNISLSFFPGAKIGVLGLNGAGKSSLLRIMAGADKDFDGEANPMPNMRIGFLPQEPQLDPAKDVRGNVEEGLGEVLTAKKRLDEIYAAYSEPDADFDKLAEEQARLEALVTASDLEHTLDVAADALRLPPWDMDVAKISGGERRRVALCRLLLSKPDMLLLDEPTNHLDALSVQWLEQYLERFPGTVVAVTHDRYFLDNVAGWILELDRGYGIPWQGNYSGWLEQKEQRLEVEAKQEV